MSCSQAQWDYYVKLSEPDWICLSNPASATYDAVLSAAITFAAKNKLYGFGTPRTFYDGWASSSPIVNGPTKS